MSKESKQHQDEVTKDWQQFKDAHAVAHDGEALAEVSSDNENSHASALESPSYLELEEKLTLAEQQAHENWEKSVRAIAELENVRRRTEREVSNAHRYGVEKFIQEMLPVMDSLEQALQMAQAHEDEGMREGLSLTIKLFMGGLEKFGVVQLNPEGETFDPQRHEAMSMQQIPGAAANSIIAVFQKGYSLHDRVIRPARVIVATGG